MLNSSKKPVTLNLKTENGCELLKDMVCRADILVENFAPGARDRPGVGASEPRKINPRRVIYGSTSGYGKEGPYRDYPAMDRVMQAMRGVIDSPGYPDQPPLKSGAALCDFMAGIHLYSAIMIARYEREHTGYARVVEVSMQDVTYASLASNPGMLHARGSEAPARMKTVVDKIRKGKGHIVNECFATMCAHYLNAPDFRKVASGWEYGVVKKMSRCLSMTLYCLPG
ncbi:Formyl-CoA:oxalate CoA-transferase [Paraburkholderia domus]|uniref:Formyl-CoA:oxalate CoA-transferase n=1 Tax=Paraburkholderia domus TaxID=2793075 RepID=A0A9N8N8N7_9BURK|nr:Formyl-CoA:oxalate CoA-transferase [Paraburkholderia domus]CAE6883717.1 Formyl-CoA:oxalate CoA-transferase [Paraburkholderia domus]CAE6960459.1 Formyl-CoA:oxalate CoA-transferase [Paraburkholderia domus]CAE6965371.1 Formyl-CoA:oxalate CoA-transferase [Paraburkholderia domus]